MRAQSTTMGLNRTGIGTSPIDSADIIKTAREACPGGAGNGHNLDLLRREYEGDAEPIGTVPIPTTLRGAVTAAVDLLKGRRTAVLVDRLGERLAFERTGTRLYEAILTKHDIFGSWPHGPSRVELQRFHDEELSHFELLRDTMLELGADPTAETPAADVIGVASSGLLQVVTDPRMTLAQSLQALLTAELTDNDGWQMLVDAARADGRESLVPRFQQAQQAEAIHLGFVRQWLGSEVENEVKPTGKQA
ncbi:MAG: ferritin-like domain-containing protein [Minicystis sp.]